MSNSKVIYDSRHDKAERWYKEVETDHERKIAQATEAGTIVKVVKWDEPELGKQTIATHLGEEPDMVKAFAMLDEVLSRQRGKYIFYHDGRVGQNTTDMVLLVQIIYTELKSILENNPRRGPLCILFLDQWKESKANEPTPTNQLPLPEELDTPRARKAIESAITHGLIESAPEGLKWRGVGSGKNTSQLAFFCQQAWLPENTEVLPETAVNNLFGVKRIGAYISKLQDVKKPQKWRDPIKCLFVE